MLETFVSTCFLTGGAADICQLCVGDEILAINEVQLSSSLTQDGIVKLIVDSVLTGNLSLDIKRYGKSKKRENVKFYVASCIYIQICFGRDDKVSVNQVRHSHISQSSAIISC